MRWETIGDVAILDAEEWRKDLDGGSGCYVSLRPCVCRRGGYGWAIVRSDGEGLESLLAIWWEQDDRYGEGIIPPDWEAEAGCLRENGIDEEDLDWISLMLRESY